MHDLVIRRRRDAEARAMLVERLVPYLKRHGIAGRPLAVTDFDGRLQLHVLLRPSGPKEGAAPQTAVLAPVSLFGMKDLHPLAVLENRKQHKRPRTFFRAGTHVYSNIPVYGDKHFPLENAELPAENVPLFAALLLGADPRDTGTGYSLDYPLDHLKTKGLARIPVYRLHEITAKDLLVVPHPGPEAADLERLRLDAEERLRRDFACYDGQIISYASEPVWSVTCDDRGRIRIEATDHAHRRSANEPVTATFRADRRDEAVAFAKAMAALYPNASISDHTSMHVFRPDLLFHDGLAQSILEQAKAMVDMLRRPELVIPSRAVNGFIAARDFIAVQGTHAPLGPEPWDGLDTWRTIWEDISEALGCTDPSVLYPDALPGSPRERWAGRFHRSRVALDLLLKTSPRPVAAPALANPIRVTSPVPKAPAPFPLSAAEEAVQQMTELLPDGGETFARHWGEARDALIAFKTSPAPGAARKAVQALGRLADEVPQSFPSASAAGRWAMKARPLLREIATLAPVKRREMSPA